MTSNPLVSKENKLEWASFARSVLILILAIVLGGTGFVLSFIIAPEWLVLLASINIFVIIGLFVVRLFKPLSVLQLPLLITASFLAGLVTALLQNRFEIVALGLLLLCLNFVVITALALLFKGEFQRFNLIIALLAIIFSFVGMMLIFVQGIPVMTLIWVSAAFICLDILLYTLLKKVFQTEVKDSFSVAAPIVLLQIGLLVNTLIGLGALFTL